MHLPGLGNHNEPLGPHRGIGHSKGGHATLPDSCHLACNFLHLLWVEVATCLDNNIFASTCDEDLSIGPICKIPRIPPTVVINSVCGLRSLEITLHGRWPAELERSLNPFIQFLTFLINDAHLVPWQWHPAGDESERRRLRG